MLNISKNRIDEYIAKDKLNSFIIIHSKKSKNVVKNLLIFFTILGIVIMFIPWTQNIRSRGILTTLKPNQKPQVIQSIIGGRIENWYVQDGDLVKKGDTLLFISEVKDEYFDPSLLERTGEQLDFKASSVDTYKSKVVALENQINALIETKALKLKQTKNKYEQAKIKVETDSINFQVTKFNQTVAKEQYERFQSLYDQGLKSLTEVENRNVALQKASNEMNAVENKYLTSQNELINAKVEIVTIEAQYDYEIAKAQSEKFSAMSMVFDAESTVSKMQNQYSNYEIRNSLYYITAPQDGYVSRTMQSGIGQTVKPGDEIISIIPSDYDLAIEMYVKPIDLPLLKHKQKVRIQFDGWPAIVFSGWPNVSYGTYGGLVYAIDNYISPNGLYRILVSPDPTDHPWPEQLRIGAATNNLTLLNDVPIWYELWRQFNGFPPDYYTTNRANNPDFVNKKAEKNDEK
jgi:membrane fusion protein, adhesin transport system